MRFLYAYNFEILKDLIEMLDEACSVCLLYYTSILYKADVGEA